MGDSTLRELVYGRGAHVDPIACLEDAPVELAARTVTGYPHSIWQIVEHMNFWMEYDLGKIAGEDRSYPDKAIDSWPSHPNAVAGTGAADEMWHVSIRRFADLLFWRRVGARSLCARDRQFELSGRVGNCRTRSTMQPR